MYINVPPKISRQYGKFSLYKVFYKTRLKAKNFRGILDQRTPMSPGAITYMHKTMNTKDDQLGPPTLLLTVTNY